MLEEVEGRIFELANGAEVRSPDPDVRAAYLGRIGDFAIETGVPVVFGVIPTTHSLGDLARVLRRRIVYFL